MRMKLFVAQEQYQELEHGPTGSTGTGTGTGTGSGSSIHSSASVSDSRPSVSSSMGMMQNLSSHQDTNNTTLPMTNGALQPQPQWELQQGSTDTAIDINTELSKKKKKNIMLLWLWIFVLFVGLMIIAIVTTRVAKKNSASRSSSSSGSSISTPSTNATLRPETNRSTNSSSSTTNSSSTTGVFANVSASPWNPTVAPSSLVPSAFPTTLPPPSVNVTPPSTTTTPSIAPSRVPSASPSTVHSARPTTLPSILPTLDSMAPTAFTLDIPNQEELYRHLYDTQKVPQEFRIKMHYEPQYLWQDETIERRWCIECTACPYNNFDLTNTICDIVHQCTVGNQIWIVNCDANYGQIFTIRPQLLPQIDMATRSRVVVPLQDENDTVTLLSNYYYHQIQIVQNATSINNGVYMNGNPSVTNLTNGTASLNLTNPYANQLCLERTATRYVTVQVCHNYTTDDGNGHPYNASQLAQLWDPLVPYHSSSMDKHIPNMANDGMTISNNTFRTFTITPGILLSRDIVMANTTTTTTATNGTDDPLLATTNMTTTTTWCLTNQHHPKSEEIVALKPCTISDHYNTGFWNIYTLPS